MCWLGGPLAISAVLASPGKEALSAEMDKVSKPDYVQSAVVASVEDVETFDLGKIVVTGEAREPCNGPGNKARQG